MKTLLLTLLLVPMMSFGQNNYSMSFDGQDDYVDLTPIDLSNQNEMSIEIWINPQTITANSATSIIRQDGGDWFLIFEHNGGLAGPGTIINFGLTTQNGFDQMYTFIDPNQWTNQWIHLVATYNGISKKIYKNGVEIFSNTISNGSIVSSNNFFNIGRFGSTTSGSEYFDGLVDETRIWSKALTQQEIQDYMNCPPTGTESGLVGYWNFEEGSGTTALDQTSNSNDGIIYGNGLIGTEYEGGYIFQLDPSTGNGLIATDNYIGTGEWGCYGIAVSGADDQSIGTGAQNTTDIINSGCTASSNNPTAANIAYNYSNGYNDWFLPSLDELNLIYNNLHSQGIVNYDTGDPNNWYWSSSESSINEQQGATNINFSDGFIAYNNNKDSWQGGVIAARSFSTTINASYDTDTPPDNCCAPTSSIDTQTACDSYTWVDGNTYSSSNNTATYTTTNAAGCDSTITLDLTITPQSTSSIIKTACSFYIAPDDEVYTSTGNYTAIIDNAAGCDSVITIDLTINPTPSAAVTQNGATLTATQTGATYQWIDCDDESNIVGEINQAFTPAVTGNYAVIVTIGDCFKKSECFLVDFTGIGELNNTPKQLIKIVDVLGRETPFKPNTPLLYIYDDGTVERKVVLK